MNVKALSQMTELFAVPELLVLVARQEPSTVCSPVFWLSQLALLGQDKTMTNPFANADTGGRARDSREFF